VPRELANSERKMSFYGKAASALKRTEVGRKTHVAEGKANRKLINTKKGGFSDRKSATSFTISPQLEMLKQGVPVEYEPAHRTDFWKDVEPEYVEDVERVEVISRKGYMTELVESKLTEMHNHVNEVYRGI